MRYEQHQSTARYLALVEQREAEARETGIPWLDLLDSYRFGPDAPAKRDRAVKIAVEFIAVAVPTVALWVVFS